jgi:hypothetical protein
MRRGKMYAAEIDGGFNAMAGADGFCSFRRVDSAGEGPMNFSFRAPLLLAVIGCSCLTGAQSQPFNEKNPRIQLASEFVRELEVLYRLQETGKKELAEDNSSSGQLVTGIRVGTRTVLEMNESIHRLDGIAVDGRWAEFRGLLKQLDSERIRIFQEMNQMAKAMISGPKPGVDYGAMAAHAPELTAEIEHVDKSMFNMAQAIFFALVDEQRLGPDGKLYHLLLTKKDRANMIQLIDNVWGQTLEDKNSSSIVSAAWAIKYGLTRPLYKCADEP